MDSVHQEINGKNRLAEYAGILQEFPIYWRIIRGIEHDYKLEQDVQLYLLVFVPTLLEYMNWVLDEAEKTGKKRLYFLSRDGYQMYLIAQKLVTIKGIAIECRYLQVSRYSMGLPGYHLNLEKGIQSICVGGINVTLSKILKRAGLTEAENQKVSEEIGWTGKSKQILDSRQIRKLRTILQNSKRLRNYMEAHSKAAYENAVGYLRQEGLCDDVAYAVVDSGWVGSLQLSIETLVKSVVPDRTVEGYYFGMYEIPRAGDAKQFHTYYFSAEKGIHRKVNFSNSLFETIVSSTEGMTMGYTRQEGMYLAVQNQKKNQNQIQMERNIAVLKVFLQRLSQIPGSGQKMLPEKLLTRFMARPTELELLCYGNHLFSDDVLDEGQQYIARDITLTQLRDQRFWNKLLILLGIKRKTIYESAWPEGSVLRIFRKTKLSSYEKEKAITSEWRHIRIYKWFVCMRKQLKIT